VFQGPPNSFQQLEHLVVVDRNIAFADKTRQTAVVERKEEFVQSTPRDVDLTVFASSQVGRHTDVRCRCAFIAASQAISNEIVSPSRKQDVKQYLS
jgi:hypothetical protein